MPRWIYDDGGRSAHFKGNAGDCAVRAIAIATGTPYLDVYNELRDANAEYAANSRSRAARRLRDRGGSPRDGNYRVVVGEYMARLGWVWVPTMRIGQGCTVHLDPGELPSGRLICAVSKHYVAVIDGIIRDTHDSTRDGKRCVYGYWHKPQGGAA